MILILAGAVFMLVGGVAARYVWQTWSEYAAVNSEPFYFTADLLGDTEMTADADNGSYSFVSPESGTWHLYCGEEHTVEFNILNHYDNLRITQNVIKYTATVDAKDFNGVTLKDSTGNLLTGSQNLGEAPATEGAKYEQKSQKLILTIPGGYTEDKTVTVEITSSEPYKKTLELNFVVHPAGTGLFYEVVDTANSPYAELIIRNDTVEDIAPTIDWSGTSLSIDNTNELTFKYDGNAFIQQPDMENKKMTVSRALKPNESVSIYFFKSEPKSYATNGVTVVTPTESGSTKTYTITIK